MKEKILDYIDLLENYKKNSKKNELHLRSLDPPRTDTSVYADSAYWQGKFDCLESIIEELTGVIEEK